MSDQRFEAAKAAMQGVIASDIHDELPFDRIASRAVIIADALLAELAKTAPKPSEPDALLMARLKAAESVCYCLTEAGMADWLHRQMREQCDAWRAAKAAHEALQKPGGAKEGTV